MGRSAGIGYLFMTAFAACLVVFAVLRWTGVLDQGWGFGIAAAGIVAVAVAALRSVRPRRR
jgi:hypothetical protein